MLTEAPPIYGSAIERDQLSATLEGKMFHFTGRSHGASGHLRGPARESARALGRRRGDPACAYGNQVIVEGGINAYADGENVIIPWAMMRFANDDELRVIVAHEIAHNAMGHIEAKRRNAAWGALFGALADVKMATQGVNTGAQYTAELLRACEQA